MLSRIKNMTRAAGYSIALLVLSGMPLHADGASDCPQSAVGGQTGSSYSLVYQSLVTETRSVQLSLGGSACGVGGGTSGSYSEQYHVGYYRNADSDAVAQVDCRTGRIIGWV